MPEYYLYLAELEILSTYAAEIHAEIGDLALVEFGSGNAKKTRCLLTAYEWAGQPFRYCPVDISREILLDTTSRLLQEYTHIEISAMHTDFASQPEVIQAFQLEKKAVAFFGPVWETSRLKKVSSSSGARRPFWGLTTSFSWAST